MLSAATEFSLLNCVVGNESVSLPNCVACSESVFTTEIMLSTTNSYLLSNCVVCSD